MYLRTWLKDLTMPDITTTDVNKIDAEATAGLSGVVNSLAYRVHEIEKHFHNHEDWFGLAAVPAGETHRADDIAGGTLAPFQLDAGNDAWGAWVQVLGSEDTPNRAGMAKFDFHKVQIVDSETTNVHAFIQFAFGATAAGAITAGDYTTIAYRTPTNQAAETAINFISARAAAGTKVWARCLAVGTNTMTIDFYLGLHEYIG